MRTILTAVVGLSLAAGCGPSSSGSVGGATSGSQIDNGGGGQGEQVVVLSLASVSPNVGPQFGRSPITIRGADFQAGAVVGMRKANRPFFYTDEVEFVDSTTLRTYSIPSGDGPIGSNETEWDESAEVIVVNPDGTTARSTNAYRWRHVALVPPRIKDVIDPERAAEWLAGTPSNWSSLSGSLTRWILGGDFRDGAGVTIGGAPATIVRYVQGYHSGMNGAQVYWAIEVMTPALDNEGPVDVTVTNPDGQSVTAREAMVYVKTSNPYIGELTVNGLAVNENGSIAGDGRVCVPPVGFTIDLGFDDTGTIPGIDPARLDVRANVAVGSTPAAWNLGDRFTLAAGGSYPTTASWTVDEFFPVGEVELTASIADSWGNVSPVRTFRFTVADLPSVVPLPFEQTWYLYCDTAEDLRGYGLCSNDVPTTAEELIASAKLEEYVLRLTRRAFFLDEATGGPVSGSADTIPNLRIRPAPAPSGWSSSGSFSLFHIGGRSPNSMSGYAPLDNAYGNNPQQEDLHNGYTDIGGFYRAGGTRGTFLFDANGVPFYANVPSVKAMIVQYDAQSNPDGGPVGTHPEDAVVLTKTFDPRDPEATPAQIGRWSTVIGDPEILEGLAAGGAIWSLARGLAWVSLQEIMHSMGEASMGPLPYGLLGGFNMDVGHYEDSWAVTVDGVRRRRVNGTGYDWGFSDCAKTTVDVRLGPLERAYLRGTILRLDPWDRWPYINGVEAGFGAGEGDRLSHSGDPRGAFRED